MSVWRLFLWLVWTLPSSVTRGSGCTTRHTPTYPLRTGSRSSEGLGTGQAGTAILSLWRNHAMQYHAGNKLEGEKKYSTQLYTHEKGPMIHRPRTISPAARIPCKEKKKEAERKKEKQTPFTDAAMQSTLSSPKEKREKRKTPTIQHKEKKPGKHDKNKQEGVW